MRFAQKGNKSKGIQRTIDNEIGGKLAGHVGAALGRAVEQEQFLGNETEIIRQYITHLFFLFITPKQKYYIKRKCSTNGGALNGGDKDEVGVGAHLHDCISSHWIDFPCSPIANEDALLTTKRVNEKKKRKWREGGEEGHSRWR